MYKNPEMQNTEKNLYQQEPPKVCLSKKVINSKLNTLFQKKSGHKISRTKRYKSKPRSHVKTIGPVPSKRKKAEVSSNGKRKNSMSGIRVRRKTFHKATASTSPEEKLSSMLHGRNRKSKILSFKGLEKNVDGDVGTQKMENRRRQKKRRKYGELDEASRLQRRTRYLLIKMKREQNLIDAYSGEGWKGQSREKIKPVKELQRAKKQILKCKLGIRDTIRQLELLSSEGCIEESAIGPDGSVFHEHIFCAKCKLRDAFPDNDIILCDGTCNCAFHQKCLEPPLATENIPPGDQGWFCKFCECKMEILEGINAHLGTQFSANSNWQDIFREAATVPDCENATISPEDQWPSDDSEDDDYDPEKNEKSCSFSRTGTEENMSDASSSFSFSCTSEEEASLQSGGLGNDGILKRDKINSVDAMNGIDSDDSTDHATNGRRQRRDVDYKKLHDEMFGKDQPENEQVSEDEDWGPGQRKGRVNESDVAGTLVALHVAENGCPNAISMEAKKKLPDSEDKRTLFRIPPNAVETLRRVFAENELPSRDVRENLSKQLDLAFEKVNKWFKNARYTALKIRKAERIKQLERTNSIVKESGAVIRKTQITNREASKINSYFIPSASGVQISKSLRKVRRRKNTKSVTTPSKKKQSRRAAAAHPKNKNEVDAQQSKAVGLKKQISSCSKRKTTSEKRVNPHFSKNKEHLYLVEMERLCCIENKLEKLRQALSRICMDKSHVSDKPCLDEPSVIYVPVAEVREKV